MEPFHLIIVTLVITQCEISVESGDLGAENLGDASLDLSNDATSRYLKDAGDESLKSAANSPLDETCERHHCSNTETDRDDGNIDEGGDWSVFDDNDEARDIIAKMAPYERLCTVDRRNADDLSQSEFLHRYAYNLPVIIKGVDANAKFRKRTTKKQLLKDFADHSIRLSTANTHSYRKWDTTLSNYIENLKPQPLNTRGNETMYWFGDNNYTVFAPFFADYNPPKYYLPDRMPAYSFGVAGAGTGVPFHWHGPGFAEVMYGKKMWFLSHPDEEPKFGPDTTSIRWLLDDFDHIAEDEVKPMICTLEPGEVIYFPDRWWHATLNTQTTVFISTFLGYV